MFRLLLEHISLLQLPINSDQEADICWIFVGYLLDIFGYLLDICWIFFGYLLDICQIFVGYLLNICWIFVGYLLEHISLLQLLINSDQEAAFTRDPSLSIYSMSISFLSFKGLYLNTISVIGHSSCWTLYQFKVALYFCLQWPPGQI